MPENLGVRELSQMWLVETWQTKSRGLPTAVGSSFFFFSVFTLVHDNNRASSVFLTVDYQYSLRAIKFEDFLPQEAVAQQITGVWKSN